ncbi:hypothetical protein PLESTB_001018200 [Pleodorina starrii]|uniref:Uncharacterized protein n=1 Tax=Pleodorina starrii TaxID=330485 RepID=A0A9W6BPF0_9CHLO|nr:hypothetical protein PLESTM_001189400 [Pleodorina starrii]GLC55718.1 hypothetical protein PLESTB_001018200 [Pleodorina starrii]GLC65465.1 hypothetical protein PLESTF_000296500 [Pleodorina starrii]
MPTAGEQIGKLLTIKANEESKGRSRHPRAPAIFRETSLDTHKTAPPEYFGPSIVPERKEVPTRLNSAARRATTRQQRAALESLNRTSQLTASGEVRSVFVPSPEQLPVCAAAAERRANVGASEWALIDTLDVALLVGEREVVARRTREAQAAQKAALDRQMGQLQTVKAASEALKAAEREEVHASILLHQAQTRQRLDGQRVAAMQLRTERENMLAEVRAAKEAAQAAKRREEQRQAAAIAAALEADRHAAMLAAMDAREAAARTRVENEVMQAQRRQEAAEQRRADAETSRRMAEMMLAQERARDGQAEAIQAAVAARAGRSGTKAMDDKRALLERQERLIAEAAREAERQEEERLAAEAEKRARQKAEMYDVNEELKRVKAAREAAAREEERRAKAAADAQSAADRAEVARAVAASRERTKLTKQIVASQRDEVHVKAKYEDVFMTEQERRLNKQLLEQARVVVGEPKQFKVIIR